MQIVPGPQEVLRAGSELLLIGTLEAQGEFFKVHRDAVRSREPERA